MQLSQRQQELFSYVTQTPAHTEQFWNFFFRKMCNTRESVNFALTELRPKRSIFTLPSVLVEYILVFLPFDELFTDCIAINKAMNRLILTSKMPGRTIADSVGSITDSAEIFYKKLFAKYPHLLCTIETVERYNRLTSTWWPLSSMPNLKYLRFMRPLDYFPDTLLKYHEDNTRESLTMVLNTQEHVDTFLQLQRNAVTELSVGEVTLPLKCENWLPPTVVTLCVNSASTLTQTNFMWPTQLRKLVIGFVEAVNRPTNMKEVQVLRQIHLLKNLQELTMLKFNELVWETAKPFLLPESLESYTADRTGGVLNFEALPRLRRWNVKVSIFTSFAIPPQCNHRITYLTITERNPLRLNATWCRYVAARLPRLEYFKAHSINPCTKSMCLFLLYLRDRRECRILYNSSSFLPEKELPDDYESQVITAEDLIRADTERAASFDKNLRAKRVLF